DFQVQSAELETELESEIERLEAINRELRTKNERYKFDIDELKDKYQKAQLKAGEDLASIERELQFVRSQQEYYKSRTRELEQDNDDLERNERAAKSSLTDMEFRLSRAVEENSHLMSEVQTKKILVDEVQRLKDELKDLNLELNVVRSRNSRVVPQGSGLSKSSANIDAGNGENPARVVHDIMSRVKDLESRLAGARTKVTPLIGSSGKYATVHARLARNRTIANPKSLAGSHHVDSLQRPTNLRSLVSGEGRSADMHPQTAAGSTLVEQRLAKSRLARSEMQQRIARAEMHTVPQRRQQQA
ncbi:NADH:ubiquinone oxidoreductase, partial [Linderina macrospora]